jgi:nitroreductase
MEQLPDTYFRRLATPIDLLGEPGPDSEQLSSVIAASTDVPDHGNLKPWRVIIARERGQRRMSELREGLFRLNYPDLDEAAYQKESKKFLRSPLLLIIRSELSMMTTIPNSEQLLSGGAFCQNLLLGFNRLGFGAKWVTGWPAYHPEFFKLLAIPAPNKILGFIHVGTPKKNLYANKLLNKNIVSEEFNP